MDAIRASNPNVEFRYIGSFHGIEKELVQRAGLPYEGIETGKWRRYWDWKNIVDLFRIPLGVAEAWWLLGKNRPDLVFSKGGFVALPVVLAAWLRRIPIWIHDSDASPGLTTKISAPFATKILLGFETARLHLGAAISKTEVVGNPIRLGLLKGDRLKGLKRMGLEGRKPILLVLGGSSGAQQLNDFVSAHKTELLEHFEVMQVSGSALPESRERGYCRVPYVNEGLADLYAAVSLALTRAGANTLAELTALGVPALLVPLSARASRGDQAVNARILSLENPLFHIAPDDSALWIEALHELPQRPALATLKDNPTQKIVDRILDYFE